jgi:HAD superfamily hydrolase (TIGR01509 family)
MDFINQKFPEISKMSKESFLSHEIKLRKSNPESFLYVIKRLNLLPREILFVDDRNENIELARKLDLKAILFKNSNQLKKEINNL